MEDYQGPCWSQNEGDGAECGRSNVPLTEKRSKVKCLHCVVMMDVPKECPACGSRNTMGPSYPGDYNDCLECGHSWPVSP